MSNLNEKIANGITEFYLESDIELIKKDLKRNGVDVEKEEEDIAKYIKRLKFTYNARANAP